MVVKNVNIMTALMVEILNQFSGGISNRSIFVLAIIGFVLYAIK